MRLSLLPKKSEFFVLFEQHAQNAVEAAEALAKLLGDFTDVENKVRDIHAIEIVKWKDIYSLVETAIDRCEDVANIVETIMVKHS